MPMAALALAPTLLLGLLGGGPFVDVRARVAPAHMRVRSLLPRMAAPATPEAALAPDRTAQKSTAQWEVHKFGGASLADAGLYRTCGDLLLAESKRAFDSTGSYAPTMAIVSAKGGTTDKLIAVVNAAAESMEKAEELLRATTTDVLDVVRDIATGERLAKVTSLIRQDEEDILTVLRAVRGPPPPYRARSPSA